jgi:hypothetical protein
MQCGERQLRLGLHGRRCEHRHASLTRISQRLREQAGFSDPRLSEQHERLPPRREFVQDRLQEPSLLAAAE